MKINSMKPVVLSVLVVIFSGIMIWNAVGQRFQEGIDGPDSKTPIDPSPTKDAVGMKIKEVCDYAFKTVQTKKEDDLVKQLEQLKLDLKKVNDEKTALVNATNANAKN